MKYLKLHNIVLALYLIIGILVLIDLPNLILTTKYLYYELSGMSEFEREMLRPGVLILEIILSGIKLIILISIIILSFLNKLEKNKVIVYVALLLFFGFMYFDLPIHICYNGLPETYWELGRHFH